MQEEEEYASTCCLPTQWVGCRLVEVVQYNHDTAIFVFETHNRKPLHLPTCSSILLRAPGREHLAKGGGDAIRPYTPIGEGSLGFGRIAPLRHVANEKESLFALLIKRYREWGYTGPQFDTPAFRASYRPPGAASNYIHELKTGDVLEFCHKSTNLKIQYPFHGVHRINLIAVGAGIAPMIQCLQKVLFHPDDTQIVLMYGNRSVRDILLREVLDEWAHLFGRLKVVYCVGSRYANVHSGLKAKVKKEQYSTSLSALSAPPELPEFSDLPVSRNQARESGWVGRDTIIKHAFPPHQHTRTFVCGLPSVYERLCGPRHEPACSGILASLGYTSQHVIKL